MLLKKLKKGYSLVEMLVYVSLLTMISIIVIQTMMSFSISYKELLAMRRVEHSALDAMERMTYSIRRAATIDTINSILGTSPGILTLTQNIATTPITTKFYVENGVLKMDIDGTYFGPLTGSNISVTDISFSSFDSGISKAIKIEMTISGTAGEVRKLKTYHSLVGIRGS